MNYKIKLETFEGPLDLLLYLIKKNDIDIKDIPIAQITEQYLHYIDMMKMLNLDVVGDFLVMAATLMQIKSRMLLPPDPAKEQNFDPRDELAQRLLEYSQFKEIAETLKGKELDRQNFFERSVNDELLEQFKDQAKEVYFESSLFDLINALSEAIKKLPEEVIHEIVAEQYTVESKIHQILHLLLDRQTILLNELFMQAKSKLEMIVTFLAVLELIRLKEIRVIQKKLFEEIEIWRNKENIVPIEQK